MVNMRDNRDVAQVAALPYRHAATLDSVLDSNTNSMGAATASEYLADAASEVPRRQRSDQSDPAAGPARRRHHELRKHHPHSAKEHTAPAMPMTVAVGSQCAGRLMTSAALML